MQTQPNRPLILAICVSIFAIGQFHRASGSVSAPILIQELALSATAVSTIIAAMFMASVAGQLPFGAILDRVGARRMMVLTTLSVAAGTALFALAGGYGQFLAARILIGLGFAVSGAAINVIVAGSFPRRDFAYVQGLIVAIGGVGGLLGTYPMAFALVHVPWPVIWLTLAGVTVCLALAILRYLPAPAPVPKAAETVSGYLGLLRLSEMRKILVLATVVWAPIVVITGLWGSAYFQEIHGLSAEGAGALLFAFYAATIAGAYGFGWLDRRVERRKGLILGAAGLSALSYGALAIWPAPGPAMAASLLILMIFFQQFHVALSAHLRGIVPAEMLGRASALFTLVAVSAIPAMQLGFGAIRDMAAAAGLSPAEGYRVGFAVIAVLIAAAALIYATARQANAQ